jgi:hypothetical protein
MESTYIDELGKAQEPLLASMQKPRVERESERCVTQTSDGLEPSQLTRSRLIQGHLPSKGQPYLNVTAYIHERSHPALNEKGFINKDDLGVYLGSTNGPDRWANPDDYPRRRDRTDEKGALQ